MQWCAKGASHLPCGHWNGSPLESNTLVMVSRASATRVAEVHRDLACAG